MFKKPLIFIVLVGLVSALSITGFFIATEYSVGEEELRVSFIPITNFLPFFVAIENGYFQEQGLNVRVVDFPGNEQAMDGLITGRTDTAGITVPIILGVEENSPGSFKIYMAASSTSEGNNNEHVIVLKDSSISSLYDLKGKSIGIMPSSAHELWTKLILKNFMDPDKDVNIVQMPSNLHLQALEIGSVDAVFAIEPTATIGIKGGTMREIDNSVRANYIYDPFYSTGWVFSSQILENNPEKAAKTIASLEKALDYMRDNEEGARKILTKYTPLTEDMVYDVSFPVYEMSDEIDRKAFQEVADILYEEGLLKSRVDTSDIYTN